MEPTIGHLKADHRLGRNFYKGVVGDAVNILMAAAAYNSKESHESSFVAAQNNKREAGEE